MSRDREHNEPPSLTAARMSLGVSEHPDGITNQETERFDDSISDDIAERRRLQFRGLRTAVEYLLVAVNEAWRLGHDVRAEMRALRDEVEMGFAEARSDSRNAGRLSLVAAVFSVASFLLGLALSLAMVYLHLFGGPAGE